MQSTCNLVAIDLGASGSRMILGAYDGREIRFIDEYRMANGFVRLGGALLWDILRMYENIVDGFRYFKNKGEKIDCVGVDAWGVDFVPLGREGLPVGFPRCYRDLRNVQAYEKASEIIRPEAFYKATGIMPAPINTAYQLFAAKQDGIWDSIRSFLFIPDFFVYAMSGEAATEYSVASTSQLVDKASKTFSTELLERLQLKADIFPRILRGAQIRTKFSGSFSEVTGYGAIRIANVASHDTGSAISLAEALPEDEMLLNNGTWAILSFIQDAPIVTDYSMKNGITNEGTLEGRARPARNMPGMFLLHQCKEAWYHEGIDYSWDDMQAMGISGKPFCGVLDISDPYLNEGGNIPKKIQEYCRRHHIPVPQSHGDIVRMILESMTVTFATSVKIMEQARGKKLNRLSVVGGGSKNRLLNEFLARATGKAICVGPAEATALGNMLAQLEGLGEITREDKLNMIRSGFSEAFACPQDEAWKEFILKNEIKS